MKKVSATLSLIVLTLLSLLGTTTAFAQQPPDNVQGNWTIYSSNVDNGETVIKHVQIAQYGNRITGYFEGPDQSGPIQGEIDGHHIRFSTVTRNVLTFRGQIYGNNMSGEYGIHGKHAPWQAMRTSGGDMAVPPPAPAVSYTQPVLAPPVPAQAPAPAYVPQPAPQYANSYAPQSNQAPAQQYPSSYAPQNSQGPSPAYSSSYAPAPAPLTSDQLNALVAPIALYPDSLVAQVLAAATNPDQVSAAEYWMGQNTNLIGSYLAQAVDQQDWDPSVKALTQFPTVLADLAKNLAWTSSLGQAYQNQGADVMAAVQVMRAKAQAAGTLQSNGQITVTQQSPNVIVIQPANPAVVYVPQYNPTIVYGGPVVVPLYTPPVAFATAGVSFGAGVSIGAFFGGGGVVAGGGWGWHAWAVNWGGGGGGSTIIYNHTTYINNNTWHSTSYNGYHPWGPGPYGPHGYVGPNGYYHPDPGYHPGTDTHYGPNGGYHPNGYYGPDGGWHQDAPGTNPAHQPNGGNNGNHGLIGGNGGVQNPNAGKNGPGVAPAGGYHNNTNNNGALGSENHSQEARNMDRSNNLSNSRMSGDGAGNRAESDRGRASMAGRHPQQHVAREHAPAEHHSSRGEHRR
jgi:hypothetical protein